MLSLCAGVLCDPGDLHAAEPRAGEVGGASAARQGPRHRPQHTQGVRVDKSRFIAT